MKSSTLSHQQQPTIAPFGGIVKKLHTMSKLSWAGIAVTLSFVLPVVVMPTLASPVSADEITVIDVPQSPLVNDPCGPSNATWVSQPDTDVFDWTFSDTGDTASVAILTPSTTFPDGVSTTNDYGTAPDSGVACPTPPPPPSPPVVHWTSAEKKCRSGVQVMAHRGMGMAITHYQGHLYPEDTIRSFKEAMRLGVCGFETDYWSTSDSRLVSNHDSTYDRMTNGSGLVQRHTLAYAKSLRVRGNARVSTYLEDQINTNSYNCFRQKELKPGGFSTAEYRRMISINNRFMKSPECNLFTTSETSTACKVKSINPKYETGLIDRAKYGRPAISRVNKACVDELMLDRRAIDKAYVQSAIRAGLKVSARNVDTRAEFYAVKAMGVVRVVTNKPWIVGRLR